MTLKILFIGDVVGSPGRKIVSQALPRIIRHWGIGLVVCEVHIQGWNPRGYRRAWGLLGLLADLRLGLGKAFRARLVDCFARRWQPWGPPTRRGARTPTDSGCL